VFGRLGVRSMDFPGVAEQRTLFNEEEVVVAVNEEERDSDPA
jgi:hypothetical protein